MKELQLNISAAPRLTFSLSTELLTRQWRLKTERYMSLGVAAANMQSVMSTVASQYVATRKLVILARVLD